MEPFFDRPDTRWRNPRGALHFYVLPRPDSALLRAQAEANRALAGIGGVGLQPAEYVHMTLQRLDLYLEEISPAVFDELSERVGASLATMDPFTLTFAPARPYTHAIEAIGRPSPAWSNLVEALRGHVAAAGLGAALTDPPHGPHYTIAYCTTPVADEVIIDRLGTNGPTTHLDVDRVVLVAVTQRPELGVFEFGEVAAWPLGTPASAGPFPALVDKRGH